MEELEQTIAFWQKALDDYQHSLSTTGEFRILLTIRLLKELKAVKWSNQ